MKFNKSYIILGIIVLLVICIIIITDPIGNISYKNNSSGNISNETISPIPSTFVNPNSTLVYPNSDYAINQINWSSYPNLQTGYVYAVYIAEPTNVISHKFIEVQILTEVKGTENRTLIREQLAGVAREARILYGQNSDINIHGTKGGASTWIVSLLPYDDTIY
jgi:hypothetical protein